MICFIFSSHSHFLFVHSSSFWQIKHWWCEHILKRFSVYPSLILNPPIATVAKISLSKLKKISKVFKVFRFLSHYEKITKMLDVILLLGTPVNFCTCSPLGSRWLKNCCAYSSLPSTLTPTCSADPSAVSQGRPYAAPWRWGWPSPPAGPCWGLPWCTLSACHKPW